MRLPACQLSDLLPRGEEERSAQRLLLQGRHPRTQGPVEVVVAAAATTQGSQEPALYAYDAVCPHAGGPLELADLEDLGPTSCSVVCPWHEYRFTLEQGAAFAPEEGTCLQLPCYPVWADAAGQVWVELGQPAEAEGDQDLELLDLQRTWIPARAAARPIDAALATLSLKEGPESTVRNTTITTTAADRYRNASTASPPSPDDEAEPSSLVACAHRILGTPNPQAKVDLTLRAVQRWEAGDLPITSVGDVEQGRSALDIPAREPHMQYVEPWKIKGGGKAGTVASRIRILHSLANVEQWAIDLAWDVIARFHAFRPVRLKGACPSSGDAEEGLHGPALPRAFFADFVRMAGEEAKHYGLLATRLDQHNVTFGSLPCHANLWDSATETASSLLARLAIVHMIHEARGLDVNPSTIRKFRAAGDDESVRILEIIHHEEVDHVATGQRWFAWICEREGCPPHPTFHALAKRHFRGHLKPPFNEADRARAGLDAQYYLPLAQGAVVQAVKEERVPMPLLMSAR